MHLRLLLTVAASIAVLGTASAQERSPCETSCGNLNITFPFGSGEGCYYSPDFLVTCNQSSSGPVPIYRENTSNIVISNMSTSKSEVEVMMSVANDCYNSSGGQVRRNQPYLRLTDFRISPKNKFVGIGCDTHAYFQGRRGNGSDGTGCISTCGRESEFTNGSCFGVGCCEVAVPQGMKSFDITLSSYDNHKNITDFNPCSYGFFVEDGKYNFSTTNFLDFGSKEKMPMLLEWAIGNRTCDVASKDADFLCKGNSECDPTYAGPGYPCRCHDGYEGNPYANECKNINECERGTHDCEHECKDLDGGYKCSCRKGFSGDGKKEGTGCTADESTIIKIVIITSVAAILLLIFISWLYLGLKKRKLMKLREKFFRQNGGIMLQQRISGDGGSHNQAKVFTIEELKRATSNYDESRIIGKGGYGTVYKGVLSDSRVVAIKKSKLPDQTQSQIEQFINEVVILSQINHRNVVKLIGCCLETEIPSLVYEYIPNGTLSDHIHSKGKSSAFTWDVRLRIATEQPKHFHTCTLQHLCQSSIEMSNQRIYFWMTIMLQMWLISEHLD